MIDRNYNPQDKAKNILNESWRQTDYYKFWKPKCIPPAPRPWQLRKLTIKQLYKTQWSKEFEQLMKNRLIAGAFRYGPLNEQNPKDTDQITNAIERLKRYQKTGNAEYLIDSANLCLVAFVFKEHPNFHIANIDDEIHTFI